MTSAYLTLAALSSPSSFQFDAAADKRLAVGKAEVEKILAESTHGGSCWSKAVSDLTAGCRDMDDDQRSRLADNVDKGDFHETKLGKTKS